MKMITDKAMLDCLKAKGMESLASLLGAEVTFSSTLDHTGKKTKKIVFEYPDTDE